MIKYTIIKSEEQYEEYVNRISLLMNNCEPNTPDGNELELLCLIVEAYEKEHYPMPELKWWEKIQCWYEDMRN